MNTNTKQLGKEQYQNLTVSKIDTDKTETMFQHLESLFPVKPLLKVEDIALFLECDERTIYNWNQRQVAPPRINVGKEVRYPKREFASWLASELYITKKK
jgi:predicted DNA-binding transcriptional regulator AlpA